MPHLIIPRVLVRIPPGQTPSRASAAAFAHIRKPSGTARTCADDDSYENVKYDTDDEDDDDYEEDDANASAAVRSTL